jgi:hypothetical protein
MPCPCRSPTAIIQTCHAAPLPFSDSALSFVKVRVVDGNIRALIPATTLLATIFLELRVVPGPNAGRTRASRPHAVSGRPMLIHTYHATLCRGLEKLLSEWHVSGMAGEQHGNVLVCVNQTRPHCVNKMGKTI